MELIATREGEPAVIAYGAYLVNEGALLRCPVLLIRYGQVDRTVVMTDQDSGERYRVQLPDWPANLKQHLRFEREELPVLKERDDDDHEDPADTRSH